jgi:two-component sensor histidine kinase
LSIIRYLRATPATKPSWSRLGAAAAVAVLAAGIILLAPQLALAHAQLILLLVVVACALLAGLAVGLAAATLGFALLLWHAFRTVPPAGASAAWLIAFDAILWFAVAKLLAALVAVMGGKLREAARAREAAEAEALRFSLREEELAHRFNNDMQMLVGLLRSEAAQEPLAAASLQRAAGRLQIVGRVHRRLLGGHAAPLVNARDFLAELVADMQAALDPSRPVAIVTDAEPLELPPRIVSDIGLAANELVTNALKYAFPDGREGIIRIAFAREGEDVLVLTVSDNGVGIGRGGGDRQGGLGMRLLRALAAQLGGRLEVRSGEVGGTVSELRFPASAELRRVWGEELSSPALDQPAPDARRQAG